MSDEEHRHLKIQIGSAEAKVRKPAKPVDIKLLNRLLISIRLKHSLETKLPNNSKRILIQKGTISMKERSFLTKPEANPMTKQLYPYFALLVVLLQSACAKQTQPPAEEKCQFTGITTFHENLNKGLTYQYDEAGRLIYIDNNYGSDVAITYEASKITLFYLPVENGHHIVFYLNNDSLATYAEEYNKDSLHTTRYFTYTEDGYLKHLKELSRGLETNYTVSYSNGNITEVESNFRGLITTTSFEYFESINTHWNYQLKLPFVGNSTYYPWLGKPHKNLLKSFKVINFPSMAFEYTYELKENGLINKRSQHSQFGTSELLMQYQCN
jgi:YD repeat-containing protein